MNVKDIIIDWLKEHDFDGLCLPEEECGCEINALLICESNPHECQPAKKRLNDDGERVLFVP